MKKTRDIHQLTGRQLSDVFGKLNAIRERAPMGSARRIAIEDATRILQTAQSSAAQARLDRLIARSRA